MKLINRSVLLLVMFLAACTAEVASYYDDVPAEPPLTSSEAAMLPEGSDVDHTADLEASLPANVDDGTSYDDDTVEPTIDVEVTDPTDTTTIGDASATDLDREGPSGTKPAYAALLHWGLHPRASDALRAAGVSAGRIIQTIGNAPASAGTHARDGYVNGQPYTAAVDISVYGLSQTQIANLLERLAKVGYAGWYRHSGYDGWYGANHIHAVYANCYMKLSLRSQIRSWLAGRNGLVSNTIYRFHTFSAAAKAVVKGKFAMSRGGTTNAGAGVSGRVNSSVGLNVRTSPSLSATIVNHLANGTYVTITCQKRGGSVTGTYGTSTLWDRISGGFVSDAFVATGSNSQIAPTCP